MNVFLRVYPSESQDNDLDSEAPVTCSMNASSQSDDHLGQTYLKRGDSIEYISQFLNLIQEGTVPRTSQSLGEDWDHDNGQIGCFQREKADVFGNKQKKIKKVENSPFHNYQKHLNNALKKLIIVPDFREDDQAYKKVASMLWAKYMLSEVKTKKILHYVFNDKNQHPIKEEDLKAYDFWEIYSIYGQNNFNQAKKYLGKLAIDQIDQDNIQGYLKTRKMKKLNGFKEYVMDFRQEISNGFLKRRTIRQV